MADRHRARRTHARRILRWLVRSVLALVVVLGATALTLYLLARPALGGALAGPRLARAERSPAWRGGPEGRFVNRRPRMDGAPGEMLRAPESAHRRPDAPVPVARRAAADYRTPPASGLRVTWLGHSTMLIEIDGQRVLTDPVWGERASPLPFVGPTPFFAPPLPLAELPAVDAVVISHAHYDHLDMATVEALGARGVRWLVPLGVGAHLAAWGVPDALVTEMDWWEAARVGGLTITATPARHYANRELRDRDRTLWAGWAIAGPRHRAFYSGDTALHDEFAAIGARLGPFDLTMMDAGQYNALWADVHLGPEQAVLAHQLVRGEVLLPVHWARFNLAPHTWTEPVERVLVAARAAGVRVATPRPGERIEPATVGAPTRWWPTLPWRSAAEAPVWSSGTDALRRAAAERAAGDGASELR